MSDTDRSEAEALADALPPPPRRPCPNHPDRPGITPMVDGTWKCAECTPARFRLPGAESTSAALRRAEQERDAAIRERDSLARRCALRFEETEKLRGELIRAGQEIGRLRDNETRWAAEVEHAEAEVGVLRRSEALEVVRSQGELRRAEAERDEARAEITYLHGEWGKGTEIVRLRAERAAIREALGGGTPDVPTLDLARGKAAELASVRESLDARTRALVRARALNGALIAEVDRLGAVAYGTTLCPRCGDELAAEVAAENTTREGETE